MEIFLEMLRNWGDCAKRGNKLIHVPLDCFISTQKGLQFISLLLSFLFSFHSSAQPLPGDGGGTGTSQTSESLDIKQREMSEAVKSQSEHVDTATGNLSLNYEELYLPGNGGLDISVSRNYDLHETNTNLQYAYRPSYRWTQLGPGWTMLAGHRIVFSNNYGKNNEGRVVWNDEKRTLEKFCEGLPHYNGIAIEHPNGTRDKSYPVSARQLLTQANWKITCSNYVLTAHSPDGNVYDFGDVRTGRRWLEYWLQGSPTIDKGFSETVLPVLSVTDTAGNWLQYSYIDFGGRNAGPRQYDNPWIQSLPTSDFTQRSLLPSVITASDGRRVDFYYNATTGKLSELRDNTGRVWVYNYHAADSNNSNVLSSVTLPSGDVWSYTYWLGPANIVAQNAINRKLKTITYPTGGSVTYTYAAAAVKVNSLCGIATYETREPRVIRRDFSNGSNWLYDYKHGGLGELNRTTVTSPAGIWQFAYMGTGYVKHSCTSIDYTNHAWQVGRLMERIDPHGNVEKYTWQKRTVSVSHISFDGTHAAEPEPHYDQTKWVADLATRTITQDGAIYKTTYSNYDTYGNPGQIVETGPNGGNRTTTFTYLNDTTKWIIGKRKNESFAGGNITRNFDAKGNLLSITENGVTTSYTYDSQGNVATKTLPRGLVHQYSNYKRGIPQTEIQPEGIIISRVVDNAGNVTSLTNGEGKTTTYTFDGLNRVMSETYPIGLKKTIAYTATTKTATRGAFVETTQYSGFGEVASINSGGITTTFNYDGLGRKKFESYPNSTSGTNYAYDAQGRITRITNPDGTYQSHNYGAGSTSITNERNYTTTYHYRSYGNPNEQHMVRTDAPESSANVVINRNARDQITSVTQAGLTRTFGYNSNYYLTSVINPETGTTTYGRDAAGNMTSVKVGGSGTTAYAYDGQNRLTSVSYPGSTPSVTHTYDKRNELLTSNTSGGNRSVGYDANGNIKSETLAINGNTYTTTYVYNGNDHLSSITYPKSGRVVNYSPDVLGRPTQVSGYANSVTYWPSGLIKQINYANGTVTFYNQNNRLWPHGFNTHKGSTYYFGTSYTYDGVGNLTNISDYFDNSYNRTLTYDSVDRLIGASGPWGTGTIAYDGVGNITQQSLGNWNLNYSYYSNKLISTSGSRVANYSHDVYGNISTAGNNNYFYDDARNLRCINCSTASQINYTYDGINQRSSVVKNGVTHYEMYDSNGLHLIENTPAQSDRLVEFIYLDNKRIAQQDGGIVSFYHNDISGSPMLATDVNGAQLWKETYRPYGGKLKQEAASTGNKIGFHGKPYDNSTGLSYMGARYYDPALGRFTGIDPVDFQEGNLHSFNRYTYANNNPYKFVDPDGKLPILLIPVITFIAKEVAAEYASRATGGATDLLSVRRMGTKAGKFAVNKLSSAIQTANKDIANKGVESATKNAVQTLEQRAADLVKKNDGKNSVTIQHQNGQVRVDLAGKSHHSKELGDVPTPHVQNYKNNIIPAGPRSGQIGSVTKDGDVKPADASTLRMVDRYLDKQDH